MNLNTVLQQHRNLAIIPVIFFIAGIILIFTAQGTSDEGDSIMHYLYARYAYDNPQHFFNHWAKPLFVFVAAPFAQLGLNGMKFFNLLVSTLTLFLTYRIAIKLNVPNAWLAPLCMAFAPMLMVVTLSGLTEPLFALWMMIGIFWILQERIFVGTLWFSFLPFVRSEGLIVLLVIFLFLIFRKKLKYIPVLMTGHLLFSVAGYFYHHDFLWVFNKMPYAVLNSAYGQGHWLHYIHNLPYVIGIVTPIFLALGIIYGAIRLFQSVALKMKNTISVGEIFLVYGMFLAYFIGHSAFWALGIFNSFGLVRVMIGILPVMGIIVARGFHLVELSTSKRLYKFILAAFVLAIMVFPFTGNKHAFQWKRDFALKADQKAEARMGEYLKHNYPEYKSRPVFYEACYVSIALNIDIFDTTQSKRMLNSFDKNYFPSGSFIIYDDWFAPVEGRVEDTQFTNDTRFQFIKEFSETDYWGKVRKVKVYKVK